MVPSKIREIFFLPLLHPDYLHKFKGETNLYLYVHSPNLKHWLAKFMTKLWAKAAQIKLKTL